MINEGIGFVEAIQQGAPAPSSADYVRENAASKSAVTRRQFCADVVASSFMTMAALPLFASRCVSGKPFVKWAGGKSQLIEQLTALFPADFADCENLTYVEPFVGGGAMAFYILARYKNIRRVIINDFNQELINVYKVVRDSPAALIDFLDKFQSEYRLCSTEEDRKHYYLQKRELYNQRTTPIIETSALFVFLNRTCFNGLYRVNSKGLYNVPFGRAANPLICDKETILADSALLQGVEILSGDFENVYEKVEGKAFFYFDPPYRPLPKTASFTAYSKDGFNDEEQKRLAAFCKKLDKEGHRWLLSNSDPSNTDPADTFFDELYKDFDIRRVFASRMINSKGNGRGRISELAIRNYTR